MDELVEHPRGGQAARDPARRRRDDRPGRGQRRRAVRRGGRVRRRRHAQARRRRARRRRAVASRRSPASRSSSPRRARSSTSSSASTPTAWRSGSSAWATSCRSSRRPSAVRRGRGQGARAQAAQGRVHARGLPRAAEADPQDGPAESLLGMIPGLAGHAAQGHEGRRARARPRRGDHPLDDARRSAGGPSSSRARGALRIAKGSGTNVQEVNQLVKQFDQMRKLMSSSAAGKMPDIGALMRQAR